MSWPNGPAGHWTRPLYPVIFVDAIVIKVRDGQVRNTLF